MMGPVVELRTLFEQKMEERVGVNMWKMRLGGGRWIRRVWRFLLDEFQSSEDFKRCDRCVRDWDSYRESDKSAA